MPPIQWIRCWTEGRGIRQQQTDQSELGGRNALSLLLLPDRRLGLLNALESWKNSLYRDKQKENRSRSDFVPIAVLRRVFRQVVVKLAIHPG